jgi:hypothetical protein
MSPNTLVHAIERLSELHMQQVISFVNLLKTKEDMNEERFYAEIDLDDMVLQQQVKPVADIQALGGTFWPEEETEEEFLTTLRKWRNGQ